MSGIFQQARSILMCLFPSGNMVSVVKLSLVILDMYDQSHDKRRGHIMPNKISKLPSAAAGPRPSRKDSDIRKGRINEAVIEILASEGSQALTHRKVASKADVSLATTTNYFNTKSEMINVVSEGFLNRYNSNIQTFINQNEIYRERLFDKFVMRLLMAAGGRNRITTMAWFEIILSGSRNSGGSASSQQWWRSAEARWTNIALKSGIKDPVAHCQSTMDFCVGLLLFIVAMDLNPMSISSVLVGAADPDTTWRPPVAVSDEDLDPNMSGRKSSATRARIIESGIELLIAGGAGAVTHRSVAEISGLTLSAPAYHFKSIESLLAETQKAQLIRSKKRQEISSEQYPQCATADEFADLTNAILLEGIFELKSDNICNLEFWLTAARQPFYRPTIWRYMKHRTSIWYEKLKAISANCRTTDSFYLEFIFIGRMIRILSTGSDMGDISRCRSAFLREIGILAEGSSFFDTQVLSYLNLERKVSK